MIMNCKTIICRILKWVIEIRIDALVSEFLEEFRLSKEPNYESPQSKNELLRS